MTAWSAFSRRRNGPVRVEHTVPPADVVPLDHLLRGKDIVMVDTPAAVELEDRARRAEALRLVEAALARESNRARKIGMRNADLADLCLEVRSALRPAPADAEVLREVPPVGIRHPAPVTPGGAA